MDAKITKQRLGRMLSYDWLKIVGIAVALIVAWSLIFTMSATRITTAQQFTVFNYVGNAGFTATNFSEHYQDAFENDVFSYEVIETNYVDLATSGNQWSTLLESRVATEEGDVIFVADIGNKSYEEKDEQGNVTYAYTYLESLVLSYGHTLFDFDYENPNSYFRQMESYLNAYFENDWRTGELNEEKVEEDFRARIKKNKDKRYKTEKQIQKGLEGEIDRLNKYRDGLIEFYGYWADGIVAPTEVNFTYENSRGDVIEYKGVYSWNICVDETVMKDLHKYVGYYVQEEGEDGNKTVVKSQNMNVAFFNMKGTEKGFEYENLLYLNSVIRGGLGISDNQNNG